MKIVYKNSLATYLSEWHAAMDAKAIAHGKPFSSLRALQPAQSLSRHEYNVCLMLELIDESLERVETTLHSQHPDYRAYSEAIVFLDAIYLFLRMLLDSVAGIIRHFYQYNEKKELPKSFDDLLKKAGKKYLPETLDSALLKCHNWFPLLKDRRDDIVHNYETYLIGFSHNSESKAITLMFSPREKSHAKLDEDLRSYIGGVLAEYQRFTDDLLDHWDEMFAKWYGIVASIASRQLTLLEGRSANILWWAYRYGGYRNKEMVVDEA